ncbi:EamA family transporter [Aliihoeflea aestuarii]|jgi:drug/metabolite transporter (DMT)-like permease|uniref:DMT family transporter n=1 Tax=Aliihoeflea aestuarii TaxID=453840 RepID=UPI0020937676|nr:DMT family transporter [Aliihoeflea aestuarii]MCO6391136.1 EamA family transporter [Aliihoeflea aestuarii]
MARLAYILLFLTALMWGGNAVAGKLAVGHVSPMMLTLLRWAVALVVIGVIGWRQLRADWITARSGLVLLLLLGAAGFAAFNAALYSALLYTSAINVSIEQAAMPMVIMAANFLLFAMRVTWLQIAGFVLSIVGVAVVASHGDLARLIELDVNRGDALMVLAVLFYSGYTVALRFKPAIHWQSTMIVMVFGATVASIPFVIWEAAVDRLIMPDLRGWVIVAYTALLPSLLSQIFFMRGVELIGANRAGLFINLVPILGTVLAILVLGEDFHAYHAAAIVLVMSGIAIAEYSGRKAERP